jgi:hypothetical protein
MAVDPFLGQYGINASVADPPRALNVKRRFVTSSVTKRCDYRDYMQQVNTYAIYLLGKWMDSIFLHARAPLKVNIQAWQWAISLLDLLIDGRVRLKLNESAPSANALRHEIETVLSVHQKDPEATLDDAQVNRFNAAWSAFENALALDLGRAPLFFVGQKGIFATPLLINEADKALADEVSLVVSAPAKRDLNEAGRCLAFGMNTASGYHALRAVEKVLREYYEVATGSSTVSGKPLNESAMATVINGIQASKKGDAKVLSVLDQLRDLHRNPINHPDVFLEAAEALELFNICTSALSAMARDVARLKPVGASTAAIP